MVRISEKFEIAMLKSASANHMEFITENSGESKICLAWQKIAISIIQESRCQLVKPCSDERQK